MSDTGMDSPPPVSVSSPSPAPNPLTERDWEKLLNLMAARLVVPVTGAELLCVPWAEQPAARLYDLWGQALAQRREIAVPEGPQETPLLYRIANDLSVSCEPGDLEYDMDEVIRRPEWPLPASLRQLAEIRDFPLLVTTTIDHLMEAAIAADRGPLEAPRQIVFTRDGNSVSNDLPKDFVPGKIPTVFHLFGATCQNPGKFAVTEDMLIEFSWALINKEYAPQRLYDFLRGKTILLLGCDFPDWLGRFFVNALTQKPDAQIAVWYVSGGHLSGLRDFLKRRKAHLLPPQSPVDFVAELNRRWKARQSLEPGLAVADRAEPKTTESKPGAVFISYAREDGDAAEAIRMQLEAAGVDTWMDASGLEPGAEFQEVIHDNIKRASFFLAIISRALDLESSDRPGRFVLKEWKWAVDENLERFTGANFLQPVVVDSTPMGADFIDRPFRDQVNWTRFDDGKLPPALLDLLTRGIRRFRVPAGANR
ncbi:MAG TPA: toll/interleukin-1 receptor domain-containing protein [Thermoanaerobaculia bacterium]|nr:toll/interleukin-1 receptor domain-containing protein [Thermoanaerobaculia bacterium]